MKKLMTKFISLALAAGMLFSATACSSLKGKLADQPAPNVVVENNQYVYTLYGDVTLTMDLNVNDYIFTNKNGKNMFNIAEMAYDLGWLGENIYSEVDNNNYDSFRIDFFTIANGDMITRVDITPFDKVYQFTEDFKNRPLESITVSYLKNTPALDTPFYSDSDPLHLNMNCSFKDHHEQCQIFAVGNGTAMNYADVVILSYILWSGAQNQGTNDLVSVLGTGSKYSGTTKNNVVNYMFY